MSLLTA
ncbi:unnamed protein product [Lathyrus oleraceus]